MTELSAFQDNNESNSDIDGQGQVAIPIIPYKYRNNVDRKDSVSYKEIGNIQDDVEVDDSGVAIRENMVSLLKTTQKDVDSETSYDFKKFPVIKKVG